MNAPNVCVRHTRSSSSGSVSATAAPAARDAGVVHEDVDVPEVGEHVADHAHVGVLVVDRRPEERPARRPSCHDLGAVAAAGVLVAAVVDRDVGAVLRQREGDRARRSPGRRR